VITNANINLYSSTHLILLTLTCPEIVVICSLLVGLMKFFFGILTQVNRSPVGLPCSEMRDGLHGLVT